MHSRLRCIINDNTRDQLPIIIILIPIYHLTSPNTICHVLLCGKFTTASITPDTNCLLSSYSSQHITSLLQTLYTLYSYARNSLQPSTSAFLTPNTHTHPTLMAMQLSGRTLKIPTIHDSIVNLKATITKHQ